jgi:hypothetical protein
MLGLASEVRDPLAHGRFRPDTGGHLQLHGFIGAVPAANGKAGIAPVRHAKVEPPVESLDGAPDLLGWFPQGLDSVLQRGLPWSAGAGDGDGRVARIACGPGRGRCAR